MSIPPSLSPLLCRPSAEYMDGSIWSQPLTNCTLHPTETHSVTHRSSHRCNATETHSLISAVRVTLISNRLLCTHIICFRMQCTLQRQGQNCTTTILYSSLPPSFRFGQIFPYMVGHHHNASRKTQEQSRVLFHCKHLHCKTKKRALLFKQQCLYSPPWTNPLNLFFLAKASLARNLKKKPKCHFNFTCTGKLKCIGLVFTQ